MTEPRIAEMQRIVRVTRRLAALMSRTFVVSPEKFRSFNPSIVYPTNKPRLP